MLLQVALKYDLEPEVLAVSATEDLLDKRQTFGLLFDSNCNDTVFEHDTYPVNHSREKSKVERGKGKNKRKGKTHVRVHVDGISSKFHDMPS